jgi:type VI protein secretion system component VasF
MALFIRQDEQRTELQKRLATELQDRAKKRSKLTDRPDGVEDSQYIKGTKTTTSLAWAWLIIIILTIGIIIWLTVLSMASY